MWNFIEKDQLTRLDHFAIAALSSLHSEIPANKKAKLAYDIAEEMMLISEKLREVEDDKG